MPNNEPKRYKRGSDVTGGDELKIPMTHFLDKGPLWHDKFHIRRMDWDENYIKMYVDDGLLTVITPA